MSPVPVCPQSLSVTVPIRTRPNMSLVPICTQSLYVPRPHMSPSLYVSRPYMSPSLYIPSPYMSPVPICHPFPYVPVSMRQTGSSLCVPVPTFPCFNATKLVPVPMCPRPHMSRSLRHKQGRPYVCPHPCLSPSLYDKACPRPYVSPSQCDKSGRPYVSPSLNAPFFMRQG